MKRIVEYTGKVESQTIIVTLEEIKKLYKKVLTMSWNDKEKMLVERAAERTEKHPEFEAFCAVCKDVLEKFPDGKGDNSILDEVRKKALPALIKGFEVDDAEWSHEFKSEMRRLYMQTIDAMLPQDNYSQEMIIFRIYDYLITHLFDTVIAPLNIVKSDLFIIQNLRKHIHCTLVDNPNFKGENPYYKRHSDEFRYAHKLWIELLDRDFDAWIGYFKEDSEVEE